MSEILPDMKFTLQKLEESVENWKEYKETEEDKLVYTNVSERVKPLLSKSE
jgi:hypothetical protein